MAHHINAAIVQAFISGESAARFGLKVIALDGDLSLLPINAAWCDAWAEQLHAPGFVAEEPLLNARALHYVVRELAPGCVFAIISTEYFGGVGEQSAAVYQNDAVVMAPATAEGETINKALRILGIRRTATQDEYATIGLHRWRDFEDLTG